MPLSYRRFIDDVRQRASLGSSEASERACHATLAALADWLSNPEGRSLDIDDLIGLVSARTQVSYLAAMRITRAVCESLYQAFDDESRARLRRLPRPIADLFFDSELASPRIWQQPAHDVEEPRPGSEVPMVIDPVTLGRRLLFGASGLD